MPATQYPGLFSQTGIFGIFPFLLPCVVTAAVAGSGIYLCLTVVPETLGWSSVVAGNVASGGAGYEPLQLDGTTDDHDDEENDTAHGPPDHHQGTTDTVASAFDDGDGHREIMALQAPEPVAGVGLRAGRQRWGPAAVGACVAVGLVNFHVVLIDDVLPLWAAATRPATPYRTLRGNEGPDGGLELTSLEIGGFLGLLVL